MKKALFALIQLPLLSSLWLLWEPAKARPVLTVLLSVVYEIVMFALAFGKKVWTKLEDKAVEHTADWILTSVSGFAPGFRRRYKKQVINDHGIFNVRGLGLINTYTLPLEGIFVDLRIDPSNPQKLNLDLIAQKEIVTSRPIWDFLRTQKPGASKATALDVVGQLSYGMDAFLQRPALAIIGPPGSGKTTLLQHIALTFASNRQRRFRVRSATPILLFLRDHIKAITSDKAPSLGNLLQDYFSESSQVAMLKPPAGWFERDLKRGKCIVLFDGLDEVAGLQQRQIVSNWVDNQVKNYRSCRFVLTARPQGYRDAPLQRAHVLEVQPFNPVQVQRFIENWYLANEIMASGGTVDASVRQRANKEATYLLRRLRTSPPLNALTVNPLLLTMIAMVHRYHGALPETRVELYAEICEVLLGRWRQTKGVQDKLTAAHKLAALRPLAAGMMERKLRDIKTGDALAVISTPLRRLGIEGQEAENFLCDLQANSGLVLEREIGHWSFAHLTFQEYLTAAQWHKERRRRNWLEMVGDSWWHETLRLYAAQGDATELVQACLSADTLPSLTLAAECLDEKCEIELSVRRAVETRVIADIESAEPSRRRFAAEVQLSRRLKSLQHIDDHREIDLEYLTCAEYQLFIDDMKQRRQYYLPDHWTDSTFMRGHGLSAVVGVRAKDAEAFCTWLTLRHGGNVKFRLPSLEEARLYPARKAELATWCREGSRFALIGLSATDIATLTQQLGELSSLPLPPESSLTLDFLGSFAEAFEFGRHSQPNINLGTIQMLTPFVDLARDLTIERDISSQSELARLRELTRTIMLNLTLKFDSDFANVGVSPLEPIIAALDSNDLFEARLLAETLSTDSRTYVSQIGVLLRDLLAISDQAKMNSRKASQRVVTRLLEFSYDRDKKSVQPLLRLYWCFQIVAARERDDLLAWEGIRIVREQI